MGFKCIYAFLKQKYCDLFFKNSVSVYNAYKIVVIIACIVTKDTSDLVEADTCTFYCKMQV